MNDGSSYSFSSNTSYFDASVFAFFQANLGKFLDTARNNAVMLMQACTHFLLFLISVAFAMEM